MKKLLFLTLFSLLSISLSAQILWKDNLSQAKNLSLISGKLILLDFYADWCGPCKLMDRELWSSPEMKLLTDLFIPVRVSVDFNRETALDYDVNVIPKVVLALCNGEMVWEMTGFSTSSDYIKVMKSLPVNLHRLFAQVVALSTKDPDAYLKTGIELQKTGKTISDKGLKESFLSLAQQKLRFAEKQTKNPKIKQQAQLYSIMVDVTNGSFKKAQKGIEKGTFYQDDPDIADLVHFILAGCYKGLKDDQNYEKEKVLVKNAELLTQLNE